MPISYVIGNTVVTSDEYDEKVALGTVDSFLRDAQQNAYASMEFSTGQVEAKDLGGPSPVFSPLAPSFTPIKIGSPLSIEILTVYTGLAPRRLFGKPDLLIASQVKSAQTFDAAPKLVNQMVDNIESSQYVTPSARTAGSPVVYYAPAVTDSTILCSFDLVAETFDKNTFDQISALMGAASGMPVFAPAGAYLMAGSLLVSMFSDLAEAMVGNKQFLTADLELRFDTPNIPASIARQAIGYNRSDGRELADYTPGLINVGPDHEQTVLVHKDTGKEYQGNAPYIIVSIDGREKPELSEFAPKLASAAILERFYRSQEAAGQVLDTIESALQLYNDLTYHEKALKAKELLENVDPSSTQYANAKALYNAYVRNITNKQFSLENIEE